jgi:Rad3-related DNA helicase
MSRDILSFFPTNDHIKGPRKSQTQVLEAIDKAFKDGYKNVLLEAPVGSGKSAIAMTAAAYYGGAHILTPRKSLQDQYLDDFSGSCEMALMKGRNAYPCTYPSQDSTGAYRRVISLIEAGKSVTPGPGSRTCDKGECKNNPEAFGKCTGAFWDSREGKMVEGDHPCPYHVALDVAQRKSIVIHNLHSFIFQAHFAGRFEPRPILIVDECHEMEGIVRGFAEVKISIKLTFEKDDLPTKEDCPTMSHWSTWMERYADKFSERPRVDGTSERSEFMQTLEKMTLFSDKFGEEFVMRIEEGEDGRSTKFVFIPKNVGNLVDNFLLDYGDKRLLMSGTIYNKAQYCKDNGLKQDETCFMRIGSTFPLDSRPIYFKDDYKVDTSHKLWDENFVEMIQKITKVLNIFDDAKGLIHTPSYQASLTIYNALKSTGRIIKHDKDDFHARLNEFYNSKEPKVLLSPICQQGVDFKYDRARFQIVLRVPYANTSDPFVEHLVKEDFPKYNHQALVVFGQQIGRVNRADDDYGVTVLMDERFGKFLSRNRNILPKWLMDGVIYK